MIEGKILHGFLERLTEEALKDIEKGGSLNHQNAMPFLIKEQFNKISKIEEEFATSADLLDFKQFTVERFDDLEKKIITSELRFDDKFNDLEKKFEDKFNYLEKKFDDKFKFLYWVLGIGFTLQSILISLIGLSLR